MPATVTESTPGLQFQSLAEHLARSYEGGQINGKTGLGLFVSGEEAYLIRALLVTGAKQTIDLQYYLFGGDVTGSALAAAILQAADRGVRVRLLVDALSWAGRDYQAAVLNMHDNVEIRLFNPVSGHAAGPLARLLGVLASPRKANRRMHNKAFIVDDRWVVLGGRNVGDRYFGISHDIGFRDADVLLTGALVSDIRTSFNAYWNSGISKTLQSLGIRNRSLAEFGRFRNRLMTMIKQRRYAEYEHRLARTSLARKLGNEALHLCWANAQLIVDHPDKDYGVVNGRAPFDQLVELAQSTRSDLLLVSPYFIPGERGMSVLAGLRERGIRVVLVTNSLAATDVIAVHAVYRRYRARLLEIGVELYELRTRLLGGEVRRRSGRGRASLHAKIYVFDQQKVVMGSLNLDPRSMVINTEIGVLMDSSAFAQKVVDHVTSLMSPECSYRLFLSENGESVCWEASSGDDFMRHRSEPDASLWRTLAVRLFGWFPIEDQL